MNNKLIKQTLDTITQVLDSKQPRPDYCVVEKKSAAINTYRNPELLIRFEIILFLDCNTQDQITFVITVIDHESKTKVEYHLSHLEVTINFIHGLLMSFNN